ncbi:MucBP domain-containing protein [Lentilactobacillus hilgardii]|uniref:MucBP domain-containing protein n=1 Tax=Lentilactobacillus hilgardii TaxID=1588 RepID=UPI0021C3B736|nr:MucBP domain-containing protein [Lentilactobacillus hilgardii]MCP9332935.1 MucBP domain-containing protein [Lentilactobacillus hilgardii]MCP9349544.1 MucBP domain-containing protein [Lentilactobacillus hilgardii]MCP9352412.1 MucBP domain-containing protein [Lentilactobacillus hilgardii]
MRATKLVRFMLLILAALLLWIGFSFANASVAKAGPIFTEESQVEIPYVTINFTYDDGSSTKVIDTVYEQGSVYANSWHYVNDYLPKGYKFDLNNKTGYPVQYQQDGKVLVWTSWVNTKVNIPILPIDANNASVTVRYLNALTHEPIRDPVQVIGTVGNRYDVSDKQMTINDYKLDESSDFWPANITGTFTKDPQTVTFYYLPRAGDITINYMDKALNEKISDPVILSDHYVRDPYDITNEEKAIPNYKLVEKPAALKGEFKLDPQTFTFYYAQKAQDVTIKYLDENDQSIAKSQTMSGYVGDAYDATTDQYQLTISGYTLDNNKLPKNGTGKFSTDAQTVTYIYKKASTPVTPGEPGTPATPITPSTPVTPAKPSIPAKPLVPSTPMIKPNLPNYAATKGAVVYSLKKIGLYRSANFSKQARSAWYVKKPRVHRPMFVVTGYTRSASGTLRYKVRDVNHLTTHRYKTGYVTASWRYVRPVYYAKRHTKITVINPRGVNAYRKENLTKKTRHYRQGTVLKVKRLAKHNLTTRFVLSNGRFVTANRKLVTMGSQKPVRYVQTKRPINRYKTVNLTKKNKLFSKNTKIKVIGFDFSRPHSTTQKGALRYRVAGGYITGNANYVKKITN